MAEQLYRMPSQPLSAQMQAMMYYARKRRRARSEATSGNHGGFRESRPAIGVAVVKLILTTA